jgi:hypothetical protein
MDKLNIDDENDTIFDLDAAKDLNVKSIGKNKSH